MPNRRIPALTAEFTSGPADKMLEKLSVRAQGLLFNLQEEVGNVWLAGGSIRCAAIGVPPRDFDFWFSNASEQRKAVQYIVTKYDHKVVADNEMTTKLLLTDGGTKIDLVKRYFGSPLETARAMDFVCCSAALSTVTYARHDNFESDAEDKRLTVNAPHRPRSSVKRLEKFKSDGWTISDAERTKLQEMASDPHLPWFDFDGKGSDY